MNIIYNGVEITGEVSPLKLQITDNAGGQPDSLTAVFSDNDGRWNQWKPEKNHTLQVKENGFDSGLMFIDEMGQGPGVFELKALSIPQNSKTARSQAWENVRLFEIGTEIAARYGFTFRPFNITNFLYQRVDQQEEADFAFFAFRCMLEGYSLKIHDKSMVVYDEAMEEQKPVVPSLADIRENQINGEYKFVDKSTDIYQKCIVRSQSVDAYIEGVFEASGVFGPTLKRNVYATNQAEANRWAKGLLRSFNKHMITNSFTINLNTNYAAGSVVNVQDTGMFDGKYFICRLVHDLIGNRSKLTIRQPLEGY